MKRLFNIIAVMALAFMATACGAFVGDGLGERSLSIDNSNAAGECDTALTGSLPCRVSFESGQNEDQMTLTFETPQGVKFSYSLGKADAATPAQIRADLVDKVMEVAKVGVEQAGKLVDGMLNPTSAVTGDDPG